MAKSKQQDGSTSSGRARGGLSKQVTPSAELSAIVGPEPLTRAELTKRVWDYIKRHDLQDSQNRRQINPDDSLAKVLGPKPVTMFEMTKLINQHVR
ncbi:MAG: SWIB/MDM2 domain-containing protein [Candidatus Competibacteraceae bacterium]|nr:SWIB/MDM2 domain-containing protein [Candidatus Competibacteraceae bacterium]